MAVKRNDLTEQITIRVSEKQKAGILLQALNKEMNVAEYIRWLIQKDLEKEKE